MPAALLGAATSYGALIACTLLVRASDASSDVGTLAGGAGALSVAALAALAAVRRRDSDSAPEWQFHATLWLCLGVLAALFPACLAADALDATRRYAPVEAALRAAAPEGVPFSTDAAAGLGAGDALVADAFLLRGLRARADLMGEGIAYWPMYVSSGARIPRCCQLTRSATAQGATKLLGDATSGRAPRAHARRRAGRWHVLCTAACAHRRRLG